MGRLGRREWEVKDQFGEKWRLRVVSFGEGAPLPSERRGFRTPLNDLIYGAFDSMGARRDGLVARSLLEVYDRLTGDSLSERVPNPLDDRDRVLRDLDRPLRRALHAAAEAGLLHIEHVEPNPWPFEQPPEVPVPVPQPAAPGDLEHFVELQIVSIRGDGVGGVACEVAFPDGTILQGVSGPDGVLRLSDVAETGTATVVLPDIQAFAPADARGSPAGRTRIVPDGVSADVDARTVIEIPPQVYRGRLIGMFFDTSKSFLLPSAMGGVRGITSYLDEHAGAQLLVVGHTDTAGTDDYNLTLSIERAEAVAAFLRDDADSWTAWFDDAKPNEKRWGTREVQLMLSALPGDAPNKFYKGPFTARKDKRTKGAVQQFQSWRNQAKGTGLSESGDVDDDTRSELVRAYMELEGTSVPEKTVVKTHGCGEFHPQDPTPDGVADPENRRVEIFVFEDQIDPAPVACRSPGCSQYAAWLARVVETIDFTPSDIADLPLAAIRLPSTPTFGRSFPKPANLPALRVIASRLVADHDEHALVFGHSDLGDDASSDGPLSLDRAQAIAALLCGDRAFLRQHFDSVPAGDAWGWEEVQWMLLAAGPADEPFYAGFIDGHRGDATISALESFQLAAGLPLTHLCDDVTLDALIDRYVKLVGNALPDASQVTALGGGSWHPPRSLGAGGTTLEGPDYESNAQPGFRRVEVFLARGPFQPDVTSCSSSQHDACPAYHQWCAAVPGPLAAGDPPGTPIRVTDAFNEPFAGASVSVATPDGAGGFTPLASGSTSDSGLVMLAVPPSLCSVTVSVGALAFGVTAALDADAHGGLIVQLPMSRKAASAVDSPPPST